MDFVWAVWITGTGPVMRVGAFYQGGQFCFRGSSDLPPPPFFCVGRSKAVVNRLRVGVSVAAGLVFCGWFLPPPEPCKSSVQPPHKEGVD